MRIRRRRRVFGARWGFDLGNDELAVAEDDYELDDEDFATDED